MEIHRLTADEGAGFRAIRLHALRDAPDAYASTFEECASRSPESWSQQVSEFATFVAVVRGSDVGVVRGVPWPAPGAPPVSQHEASTQDATLASMWVEPTARGQGIGEALIDTVVDWARASGFRMIRRTAFSDRAAARRSIDQLLALPFGRLIVGHGTPRSGP